MSEESYEGIPRNKIPWYPSINYEKCISCGKCVDFCHMGAFAFEEKEGKKRSVVKNPNSCVVFCRVAKIFALPLPSLTHQKRKHKR